MLVLSRKVTEPVFIGDGIKITVLEVRGNTVKLGFEAPDSVSINRTRDGFEIGEHLKAQEERNSVYQCFACGRGEDK